MGETVNPPAIALACPFCAKNVGFELVYWREMLPGKPGGYRAFNALCVCPVCGMAIVAFITNKTPDRDIHFERQRFNVDDCEILHTFPKTVEPKAPDFTPPAVERIYLQGLDNLRRRNHDACVIMMRKAVEMAAASKDAAEAGLARKIRWLAENHKITADMADWADEIRLAGNEAAHGDEPIDEGEASSVAAFAELFLMYLFQLPGMLAERREGRTA